MRRKPFGFTLIEMLGVIFIIALLMGIAFPFLAVVRNHARRTRAHQQAQQAARAWSAYLLDESAWPDENKVERYKRTLERFRKDNKLTLTKEDKADIKDMYSAVNSIQSAGAGQIQMSKEICKLLYSPALDTPRPAQNVYLELNEEEKEAGYLDSWGVLARKNSPNTSLYEKWQIRVAFDHDYDGYCNYKFDENVEAEDDGNVTVRQSVIAWSVGPDGESGTEDDIITWRRKPEE